MLISFTSRHEFHKACVDPWLLEHRTCPMCKLNILKALGMVSVIFVFCSRDSMCIQICDKRKKQQKLLSVKIISMGKQTKINKVATVLEIKKIRETSEKVKRPRIVREESENLRKKREVREKSENLNRLSER